MRCRPLSLPPSSLPLCFSPAFSLVHSSYPAACSPPPSLPSFLSFSLPSSAFNLDFSLDSRQRSPFLYPAEDLRAIPSIPLFSSTLRYGASINNGAGYNVAAVSTAGCFIRAIVITMLQPPPAQNQFRSWHYGKLCPSLTRSFFLPLLAREYNTRTQFHAASDGAHDASSLHRAVSQREFALARMRYRCVQFGAPISLERRSSVSLDRDIRRTSHDDRSLRMTERRVVFRVHI